MKDFRSEYVMYLSKIGGRESPLILEMLDRYNVYGIRDLTDEQIVSFYNEVIENERESKISQYDEAY